MRKPLLTVLFSFLIIPFAFCQDVITTKTGEEMQVKVVEITPNEVRYKKADKPDVLIALPKNEIFMIRYENGTKEVFTAEPQSLQSLPSFGGSGLAAAFDPNLSKEDLLIKGRTDAEIYYKDYKTAGTMTFVTTFLFPPAGLITAIGTSSTRPSLNNLEYPNAGLFSQPEYARGYTEKAKKIKSGKVWKNFGLGMGTLFVFALIVNSNGQ